MHQQYDLNFYDAVMNSFDHLPLAALVNKAFFCVHGGLSPDVSSLEEVKAMDRFQEIPREGPMCDLLWSDPFEEDASGHATNPDASSDAAVASKESHSDKHPTVQESTQWFGYNDTRQCSYVYGVEAVKQFLKDNKLTSVIRAHEAQVDGYKMQMINKSSGIPRVITIFSAPKSVASATNTDIDIDDDSMDQSVADIGSVSVHVSHSQLLRCVQEQGRVSEVRQ